MRDFRPEDVPARVLWESSRTCIGDTAASRSRPRAREHRGRSRQVWDEGHALIFKVPGVASTKAWCDPGRCAGLTVRSRGWSRTSRKVPRFFKSYRYNGVAADRPHGPIPRVMPGASTRGRLDISKLNCAPRQRTCGGARVPRFVLKLNTAGCYGRLKSPRSRHAARCALVASTNGTKSGWTACARSWLARNRSAEAIEL